MKSPPRRDKPSRVPSSSSSAAASRGRDHHRAAPAPRAPGASSSPPMPPPPSSSSIRKKKAGGGGGGGGGPADVVISMADVAAGNSSSRGGVGGGGKGSSGMLLDVPNMSVGGTPETSYSDRLSGHDDIPPQLLHQIWQEHHRNQRGGRRHVVDDDDDDDDDEVERGEIMMAMVRMKEGNLNASISRGMRVVRTRAESDNSYNNNNNRNNGRDYAHHSSSSPTTGRGGGGGDRGFSRKGSADGGSRGGGFNRKGSAGSSDKGPSEKGSAFGGSRQRSDGRGSGRGGGGGGGGGNLQFEEAVDVPHFDDIMRRPIAAPAVEGGRRRPGGGKKAVVVDDDDGLDGADRRGGVGDPTRRKLREALQKRSSLDGKLVSIGGSSGRQSSAKVFEALWGGGDRGDDDDDAAASGGRRKRGVKGKVKQPSSFDDEDGPPPSGRFSANSDGSDFGDEEDDGRRPLKLLKTVSGKVVGFMRSDSVTAKSYRGGAGGRGYYDPSASRCSNLFSSVKLTAICVVFSMAMSVIVGALVVLVPLWMTMDERVASAELGGLAYDGVASGGGGDGGGAGGNPGSSSSSSSSSSTASASVSSPTLKPPPYDLSVICGQPSLNQPGGYDKCVAACLPSQCCLVPKGEPYEVWAPPPSGVNGARTTSFANSVTAGQQPAIGTIIQSCFDQHPDQCVQYNNQCSILGASVLLPRSPPSADEVAVMTDAEKLRLAEQVNHSCGKLHHTTITGSSAESECRALCRGMDFCFDARRRRRRHLRELARGHRELEVSHIEIPGDEDFAYTEAELEEESTTADLSATTTTTTAAVSEKDLCVIYAGCAPLFGS